MVMNRDVYMSLYFGIIVFSPYAFTTIAATKVFICCTVAPSSHAAPSKETASKSASEKIYAV